MIKHRDEFSLEALREAGKNKKFKCKACSLVLLMKPPILETPEIVAEKSHFPKQSATIAPRLNPPAIGIFKVGNSVPDSTKNSAKCTKAPNDEDIAYGYKKIINQKKNNKIDIDRIDDSSSLEILYILLYIHI